MAARIKRKKEVLKAGASRRPGGLADDDDGDDVDTGKNDTGAGSAAAADATAVAPAAAGGSGGDRKQLARLARRWAFDEGGVVVTHHDVVAPTGFIDGAFDNRPDSGSGSGGSGSRTAAQQDELVYRSAMGIGTAPGKQLFMTAFMLYMSGNTLQIFSIMMLGMALWQPIQKIMTVNSAFAKYKESHVNLAVPKLLYVLCNLAGVALALYKLNSMGLLPTSALDWLPTPPVQRPLEISSGTFL